MDGRRFRLLAPMHARRLRHREKRAANRRVRRALANALRAIVGSQAGE